MSVLSNGDMITGTVPPTADINPKSAGALYIDYSTGVIWICKDNTKNKNVWENQLLKAYPIGCMYISMSDISPETLFGGKWKRESGDRTLWLSDSGAGDYIAPGLPNITGGSGHIFYGSGVWGAFYHNGDAKGISGGGGWGDKYVAFSASRSSSIYGNSSTVQPPAVRVYAWTRIE